MDLDPDSTEYKQLEEIGVDNLTNLDNSVISKYEGGNIPKRRNRHMSLIWGLHRLNVIQTVDEANKWLFEAAQGALAPKEQLAIFGSTPAPLDKPTGQLTQPIDRTNAQKNQEASEETNAAQSSTAQDGSTIGKPLRDRPITSSIAQPSREIVRTIVAESSVKNSTQSHSPPHPEPELHKWTTSNAAKIFLWSLLGIGIAALLFVVTTRLSSTPPLLSNINSQDNTASDNTASDDTASDGTVSDGTVSDGTVSDGTASDGTASDNLISNGDFSNGMDGWAKREDNAGALEVYVEDEALCANIIEPGAYLTFVSLEYLGLQELSANTEYTLSFDVDVETPRTIGIQLRHSFYRTQRLTSGSQSIKLTFFQDTDNSSATFLFRLGDHASGNICFDNIVIAKNRLITLPEKTAFSADPNNILLNGEFDTGMRGWWVASGDDSEFSLSVKNGELCSEILTEGDHFYANHFGHRQIFSEYTEDPSQNVRYILSFDITKSTTEGKIQFGFPGTSKVLKEMVVQQGPQRIEGVELQYQELPDSENLMFLVGLLETNSIVCFDNIELVPVKDSTESS